MTDLVQVPRDTGGPSRSQFPSSWAIFPSNEHRPFLLNPQKSHSFVNSKNIFTNPERLSNRKREKKENSWQVTRQVILSLGPEAFFPGDHLLKRGASLLSYFEEHAVTEAPFSSVGP